MKKLTTIAIGVLLAGVLLTGCNTGPQKTKQASDVAKKKLVVGTGMAYYPIAMMDKNGKLVGYDIDLVNGLGEYLNMEIELQAYNSLANIISALQAQKVDLIADGAIITDKRKEAIDFSTPYLETYLNVAVVEKYKNLSNLEELDRPGIVIGVSMGSTGDSITQNTIKHATIKKFEGTALTGQALINNKVDAIVADEIWMKVFKTYNPSITVLPARVGEVALLGIGINKGNQELLDKINAYLKEYKESGAADKNYEKWLINDTWRELVPPKQY